MGSTQMELKQFLNLVQLPVCVCVYVCVHAFSCVSACQRLSVCVFVCLCRGVKICLSSCLFVMFDHLAFHCIHFLSVTFSYLLQCFT